MIKYLKNKNLFFLQGDFKVNLLNYNNHNPTDEFLDSLASNLFDQYILQPTLLTSQSKTLIDNMFSNIISAEAIFDHLTQFMIVPNVFCNPPSNKADNFERD